MLAWLLSESKLDAMLSEKQHDVNMHAPAGNRTRVTSLATMYSATRPLVLLSSHSQSTYPCSRCNPQGERHVSPIFFLPTGRRVFRIACAIILMQTECLTWLVSVTQTFCAQIFFDFRRSYISHEWWQLRGSNPRPFGMAPWATALDHSAKLSCLFSILGMKSNLVSVWFHTAPLFTTHFGQTLLEPDKELS